MIVISEGVSGAEQLVTRSRAPLGMTLSSAQQLENSGVGTAAVTGCSAVESKSVEPALLNNRNPRAGIGPDQSTHVTFMRQEPLDDLPGGETGVREQEEPS